MPYSALPTRWSILAKEGAFGGSEVLDLPALGERQARTCKRHAYQALLRSLTVNKLPQAYGLCQSLFWEKKVLHGWNNSRFFRARKGPWETSGSDHLSHKLEMRGSRGEETHQGRTAGLALPDPGLPTSEPQLSLSCLPASDSFPAPCTLPCR